MGGSVFKLRLGMLYTVVGNIKDQLDILSKAIRVLESSGKMGVITYFIGNGLYNYLM